MKRRIRKAEVITKVGWSKSTLNQRVKDGKFPKPTYEGITPYWLESEVDGYIDHFFNLQTASDQDSLPTQAS